MTNMTNKIPIIPSKDVLSLEKRIFLSIIEDIDHTEIVAEQKVATFDIMIFDKLFYYTDYENTRDNSVKMAAAYPRYIALMQHVGRHDLYEELGADVKEYGELIEKELEDAAKLPFGM